MIPTDPVLEARVLKSLEPIRTSWNYPRCRQARAKNGTIRLYRLPRAISTTMRKVFGRKAMEEPTKTSHWAKWLRATKYSHHQMTGLAQYTHSSKSSIEAPKFVCDRLSSCSAMNSWPTQWIWPGYPNEKMWPNTKNFSEGREESVVHNKLVGRTRHTSLPLWLTRWLVYIPKRNYPTPRNMLGCYSYGEAIELWGLSNGLGPTTAWSERYKLPSKYPPI